MPGTKSGGRPTRHTAVPGKCMHAQGAGCSADGPLTGRAHYLGLADGALLGQLGSPTHFAWLVVMFPLAQLLLQATSLEQFLEAPQGSADRFTVVNTHP